MDYVFHEDIIPYSSSDAVPIQNEYSQEFFTSVPERGRPNLIACGLVGLVYVPSKWYHFLLYESSHMFLRPYFWFGVNGTRAEPSFEVTSEYCLCCSPNVYIGQVVFRID